MSLYRLLEKRAFEPKHIDVMVYAFEAVCVEKNLQQGKDDAMRELVATRVIDFAQRGELDPQRLRGLVLESIETD